MRKGQLWQGEGEVVVVENVEVDRARGMVAGVGGTAEDLLQVLEFFQQVDR
jgi:hypothetical protein